ncbi:MAG TPA: long-chain fatty acid--CoA ligase [Bacteroidia bacterium]|nr:long-chain fatty acid--CoA ligase [Bacteroidia bacterium]HRS57907.1 long-chain fatty acid--CoA ligase [Bacteroidia bacterium]HRU68284.1 long-chain fatty acid--CoA ligase [Bacteroidia bacterium]
MNFTRLFDILEYQKNYDKEIAICSKVNGKWTPVSSSDYILQANYFSYGLLALGIKPGDKIATITNSRPEWNIADMGIMQIGAIHIPIYPNITEEEYDYILRHSESKYVFISSDAIYSRIRKTYEESGSISAIYSFEKINGIDKLWTEILELGKNNQAPEKLEEIKSSIQPDDVATIIYTSGTTGKPKGVMLSHNNIISNVKACRPNFPIDETSRILSYLPVCHVYERMVQYVFQYAGCSIYYVENMGTIVDNIQEIKPHAFTTVPRLLEKVYDRIMFKGRNLKGIKKAIFFWAVKLGDQYKEVGNSAWYLFKLKIADKLVFSKWRAAFGNEILFIISGGAALQERLARIFWAAGVPVLEGYGMTESSPVIAVNELKREKLRFGTVGVPLNNIEVKIAEDGEILTRGPHVMKGYYKAPELTDEVIDDEGWLHTGDLGILADGKFLKITGRKKSMFKTSMGKYIIPELMETKLRESKFIEQCMILGENQKFVAAIISPDFQYLKNWCNIKGHGFGNKINVVKNPEVRKRFQKEIDYYNQFFNPHEQIIKFELVPDEWAVETGELTPTLKVKRSVIEKKYEDAIKKLFK